MKKTFLLIIILFSMINAELLTLENAEKQAIEKNFSVQQKKYLELAREWEKKAVISGYLPQISYSLTYLKMLKQNVEEANEAFSGIMDPLFDILTMLHPTDTNLSNIIQMNDNVDTIAATPNTLFQHNLTHEFSLNQPISNGGVEIMAIRIAKYTKKAIELEFQSTKQNAIYNTRKAYLDALSAIARTKVAIEDLEWVKANLRVAEKMNNAGKVPITDVLQWQSDLSQRQSSYTETQATEEFMILNLLHSIGLEDKNIETYTLDNINILEEIFKQGRKELSGTIETSPDLLALKEYTKVSKESKNIAISSFLPKLNAFASFSISNKIDKTEYSGSTIENGNWYTGKPSISAGAVLSIPIFSGLKNSRTLKKAKYEYEQSLISEKEVESQLSINLERIKLFYNAKYEGVLSAQKQMDLMKKNLDIMQSRYDGGLVNQSQLREVALGYKQTRIGYIQKLFECLLLEAEFKKNIGRLEAGK